MIKKLLLYLGRWQLSTPLLAPIVAIFQGGSIWGTPESWVGSSVANLIGGAIFFWVDRFIFTSAAVESWHFKESGICDECGKESPLWRLVLAPNYDKRDANPEFLCMGCSKIKTDELRKKGVKVRGKTQ
jgi:hypothetical protein